MKKAILLISGIAFLAACGGGKGDKKDNDTIVSPQMKEIQKSSDSIKTKSEDLNKKADSLLKNI